MNLLGILCFFLFFHLHPVRNSPFLIDDYEMHPKLKCASKSIQKRSTIPLNPENKSKFWEKKAQNALRDKLKTHELNKKRAKNVILFLGDGMSLPTVTAARTLNSQNQLSFDQFPFSGLVKTYCVDRMVPDSACTATAYLCGIKGNYGTIGVTGDVQRGNCDAMKNPNSLVQSIAYYFQGKGRKTGLVTTSRVTHASPAGVYAHTPERNWEWDSDVQKAGYNPKDCPDIASQLISGDTVMNLVFGGGQEAFLPNGTNGGKRTDQRNLIQEWLNSKGALGQNAYYIENRKELVNLPIESTDNVLGLFSRSHMEYHLDKAANSTEPSLEEMTEFAIRILNGNNSLGYFLFVEGARIDMGHHAAQAHRALDETLEFSKAIKKSVQMTNPAETLIIVTSDHSHTMSISGYPDRKADIYSFAPIKDRDKLPYTILNYANGPGFKSNTQEGLRYDLSQDQPDSENYQYPGVAPLAAETHGGDDVGVFALGPWAHLFSGVLEQNEIPHLIAHASCIGKYTYCDQAN